MTSGLSQRLFFYGDPPSWSPTEALRAGLLFQQSLTLFGGKTWKRRLIVVLRHEVLWFEASEDARGLHVYQQLGKMTVTADLALVQDAVHLSGRKCTFSLKSGRKTMTLLVNNEVERAAWLETLERCLHRAQLVEKWGSKAGASTAAEISTPAHSHHVSSVTHGPNGKPARFEQRLRDAAERSAGRPCPHSAHVARSEPAPSRNRSRSMPADPQFPLFVNVRTCI